jgi:pectin methylesterase-like acyl-CoA thioesterase
MRFSSAALAVLTFAFLPGAPAAPVLHTAFGPETVTAVPSSARPEARLHPDLVVAQDGSGDATTLGAALASAPAGTAADPTVIVIKPGVYVEKLTLSKPWTYLIGATRNPADVVLQFNVSHGTIDPATGLPYGTSGSAALTNAAADTVFRDLTVQNAWDPGAHPEITDTQAVALRTLGDRQVYDHVRVLGRQDTLLVNSPSPDTYPRVYFTRSYVEGTVDFIFGRATAVFEHCTIHGLDYPGGILTAPSTSAANPHGLLFLHSRFTLANPENGYRFGRPWRGWADTVDPANVSRGQAWIVQSRIGPGFVTDAPWIDFSGGLAWTEARFAEYRNTGPGAVPRGVVNADRPQLTPAEGRAVTAASWLAGADGWAP